MQVFLFPLVNSVLYPSTSKPLNVFEPRYVEMIKDAIASQTPVAIGFIEDPSAQPEIGFGQKLNFVRPIAGYGEPIIYEERLDGSLLVFVQGRGKVELGPVHVSQKPYLILDAKKISEVHEVRDELQPQLKSLKKVLNHWIQTHINSVEQREQIIRNLNSSEEIIGCFASYLISDYDMQQLILEENDINSKIKLIYRLVESSELI
jgi:uncharacterized protein